MARTRRGRLAAVPAPEPEPELTPGEATPPERMSDTYLKCHSQGHWWDFVGDANVVLGARKKVVAFTRRYECQRCGEVKRVTRGTDFVIASATYTQPPGYRMDRADTSTSTRYTAMAELMRREGARWV